MEESKISFNKKCSQTDLSITINKKEYGSVKREKDRRDV
jgi:hypothetical protein